MSDPLKTQGPAPSPTGVGDERRRQVRIVLFHHPRPRVAERFGDDR